jgi:hypothetical protein
MLQPSQVEKRLVKKYLTVGFLHLSGISQPNQNHPMASMKLPSESPSIKMPG